MTDKLIFVNNVDVEQNVIATYFLQSKTTLADAAWNLSIGQSVGNPNVRNEWETDDLFIKYSCKILHKREDLSESSGKVNIAFPIINTDWNGDGISHLLCQLMGGQMDISTFKSCRLNKLEFPKNVQNKFLGPKNFSKTLFGNSNLFNLQLLNVEMSI